jgi:hypothetical protein
MSRERCPMTPSGRTGRKRTSFAGMLHADLGKDARAPAAMLSA